MKQKQEEEKEQQTENWLIGFGYDHNLFQEGKHPSKQILDQISTERPVMVVHTSGHMGVLNSKALELAHIDEETKDPTGGKIGRMEGSMEPSGYLEEAAFMAVVAYMAEGELDIVTLFQKAQQIYFRHGITTAQDGFTQRNDLELLKQFNENGVLKIDVVAVF